MSFAEMRGYIRAFSVVLASHHVERILERHRLKAALRGQMAEMAVDQLVAAVARDILNGPHPVKNKLLAA